VITVKRLTLEDALVLLAAAEAKAPSRCTA
jgi:hypothetical protein